MHRLRELRRRARATGRGAVLLACVLGAAAAAPAGALVLPHNAIANPGFTQGLLGWHAGVLARGGALGYPVITTSYPARCDGAQEHNRFLALDVPRGADGYIQQQITVPRSPGRLTFRAWGNLEPVRVTVSAITAGGAHILSSFQPPSLQASPSSCSGRVPTTKSLDVSRYAGERIVLRIAATAGGFDGTIADFDDFALRGTLTSR